jgi:hypothetical protein
MGGNILAILMTLWIVSMFAEGFSKGQPKGRRK